MSQSPTDPQYPSDPAFGQPPYAPQQPYYPAVPPPPALPSYGPQSYAAPGYGHPYPGQPYPAVYAPAGGLTMYGIDPVTGLAWSDKSKTTAGLLSLLLPFVGVCGVGRLYSGNLAIGLSQLIGFIVGSILILALVGLVIAPAIWLWAVIDGIVLLASGGKDRFGRPLR